MDNKKPSLRSLGVIMGVIVFFLLSFIFIQEYTLQTGEEVYLETVPVDPRDPLRGDYVILRYQLERDTKVGNFIRKNNLEEGSVIYMSIKKSSIGVGTIDFISSTRPKGGLFIKGKIENNGFGIDLGIGKYFVPEGTGKEIEKIRSDMQVLTIIDKYGVAKIKSLYYQGSEVNPDTFVAY